MDVADRLEKIRSAIELLGPSEHVCTLYDRREEEVAIAVSFLRAGLERGEQCVCVVDDSRASILGVLEYEGVDVDAVISKGRLAILTEPLRKVLGSDMIARWLM